MAKPQLLLLLAALLAFAVVYASSAGDAAAPAKPSVLIPVAKSPLPADDEVPAEDEDAGDTGSPLGTYMVEPESSEKGGAEDSKKSAAASNGGAISVGAVVAAAAAGYFVS